MIDSRERQELGTWLVERAKELGADGAAVIISHTREFQVSITEKKIERLKESTRDSLKVRLYIENKYSVHRTCDLRPGALQRFMDDAVGITRYLSRDPYRGLPEQRYFQKIRGDDLHIVDDEYSTLGTSARLRLARDIEEEALYTSDKIISVTASYWDAHAQTTMVFSNGFAGEAESTLFSVSASVSVRDGDRGKPEDWDSAGVRFYADLPSAAKVGMRAADRALQKIGQNTMESGLYDVIVENRAAPLLLGGLYRAMRASCIQQRQSFLEGMLGSRIASKHLTLIDDPFLARGLGSRHFDLEGIAAERRVMIEKGVLKTLYVDAYYGRKLGIEVTSGSPSNVLLENGQRSLGELVRSLMRGILITGFIGGNSNSTTGDFSYGIVGHYVENGASTGPLNEMNLSGNHGRLWNQLIEVGNDPYAYAQWRLPSLMFEGLQLTGGRERSTPARHRSLNTGALRAI